MPQVQGGFPLAQDRASLGSKFSVRGGGSLAGHSGYPGTDPRALASLPPARSSPVGPDVKSGVIPTHFPPFPSTSAPSQTAGPTLVRSSSYVVISPEVGRPIKEGSCLTDTVFSFF